VEVGLVLLLVAVALFAMFTFIRNSVSSRVKAGADTFGHGLLYNGQ
jgi:Flp pilus assembly pilin Flp